MTEQTGNHAARVGATDDEELEAKATAGDSMARRELFHRKVGGVAEDWLLGKTRPDSNGRLPTDPLYTGEAKQ